MKQDNGNKYLVTKQWNQAPGQHNETPGSTNPPLILWYQILGLSWFYNQVAQQWWVTGLPQQRARQGTKISSKRISKIPDACPPHLIIPAGPSSYTFLSLLWDDLIPRPVRNLSDAFLSAEWQYLTTTRWDPGHWWLSEYSKCQFKARTDLIRMDRGSDRFRFTGQSFLIHFNDPRDWYWL